MSKKWTRLERIIFKKSGPGEIGEQDWVDPLYPVPGEVQGAQDDQVGDRLWDGGEQVPAEVQGRETGGERRQGGVGQVLQPAGDNGNLQYKLQRSNQQK